MTATPKTYTVAGADVTDLAAKLMSSKHEELIKAKVTVTYIMVTPPCNEEGEITGPAIKVHGWQAQACIKINSTKDRVAGKADCDCFIDADAWKEKSERERMALLHHELMHIMTTDKIDDNGRPKLKMRPHDAEIGIFWDSINDFGQESPDKQAVDNLAKGLAKYVQGEFCWG
jgi:hypothetical protein